MRMSDGSMVVGGKDDSDVDCGVVVGDVIVFDVGDDGDHEIWK